MSAGSFYRAFEDKYRGPRELILSRQEVYLPFVRPVAQMHPGAPVVDLGCGRGEWLELLRQNGIAAYGVDLDAGMLAACRELNLDVHEGEVIEFLKSLPDAGHCVVSGFHIAEHLPFDALETLVVEAHRVLRPGGVLILETPNPENLAVGTCLFYMDPTHVRPLPPRLLAFVAQFAGFGRVTTLRLHEGHRTDAPLALIHVLANVSQDYAIIAQKNGVPAERAAVFDALFARPAGVTLDEMAERYEQQLAARLRELDVRTELARESGAVLVAAQRELTARVQALESAGAKPGQQQHAADSQFHLQEQVKAMRSSTSWRVTAPLRWVGAQRNALRDKGVGGAARAVARDVLVAGLRTADRVLTRFPTVRAKAVRLARLLGLDSLRHRLRPPPAPVPVDPASMTATAQRVHEALLDSLRSAAPRKDE